MYFIHRGWKNFGFFICKTKKNKNTPSRLRFQLLRCWCLHPFYTKFTSSLLVEPVLRLAVSLPSHKPSSIVRHLFMRGENKYFIPNGKGKGGKDCTILPLIHSSSWPRSIRLLHKLQDPRRSYGNTQEYSQTLLSLSRLCFLCPWKSNRKSYQSTAVLSR